MIHCLSVSCTHINHSCARDLICFTVTTDLQTVNYYSNNSLLELIRADPLKVCLFYNVPCQSPLSGLSTCRRFDNFRNRNSTYFRLRIQFRFATIALKTFLLILSLFSITFLPNASELQDDVCTFEGYLRK